MRERHATADLPSLEDLQGASRMAILRCLDLLKELDQQGIRAPDGYLYALSQEVMRCQRPPESA